MTKERKAANKIDHNLIEKTQEGDTKAFSTLVERHYSGALAHAIKIVNNEDDARDILQDCFLKIYLNINTFRKETSFYSWLYKIVNNCCIDFLRTPYRRDIMVKNTLIESMSDTRTGRMGFGEASNSDIRTESYLSNSNVILDYAGTMGSDGISFRTDCIDPIEVIRHQEMRNRLESAVKKLTAEHRKVFVMQEIKGMTCKEMAKTAKVSTGTVMSRLFNARQKLQKSLADCYVEQIGPIPKQNNRKGNRSEDSKL